MAKHYWRRWFVEVGVPATKAYEPANPAGDSQEMIEARIKSALTREFGVGYDFELSFDNDY